MGNVLLYIWFNLCLRWFRIAFMNRYTTGVTSSQRKESFVSPIPKSQDIRLAVLTVSDPCDVWNRIVLGVLWRTYQDDRRSHYLTHLKALIWWSVEMMEFGPHTERGFSK